MREMDKAQRVSFEEGRPYQDQGRGVHEPGMLEAVKSSVQDYFSNNGSNLGSVDGDRASTASPGRRRRRASLSIEIPPSQVQTNVAFTALQYLPMPILVLNSHKQVVLANEAMGRLFGVDLSALSDEDVSDGEDHPATATRHTESATHLLQGTTLGQLGVDLLQGGSAVYVSWEDVLQNVVDDAAKAQQDTRRVHFDTSEDQTPVASNHSRSASSTHSRSASSSSKPVHRSTTKTEVHDAVVDIVFSTLRDPKSGLPLALTPGKVSHSDEHIEATLIISIWATEEDQYFTLTFTAASAATLNTGPGSKSISSGSVSASASSVDIAKTTSRVVARATNSHAGQSGPSSQSSNSSSIALRKTKRGSMPTSHVASPNTYPRMDFPPKGPPLKSTNAAEAPTIFTKTNRMKDAILNTMSIPAYAMWKDSSFGVPNKAILKLIYPYLEEAVIDHTETAIEFLERYKVYKEDFSERIPIEDLPISRLMREQKGFSSYKCGMHSPRDGSRLSFDVQGETMLDGKGNFIGGLVLFHDITTFTKTINQQKERNDRQFEDITNGIAQMVWRTTPTGEHDYFSQRWYDYTGLTVEDSLGGGWVNGFHPDDLEIAKPKWAHCLATGDEYLTEYRCRSAAGDYRWVLGRAVPMRDEEGNIVKWFGTCTDIHDQILAREEAEQAKSQLGRVIEHTGITLWAVNKERALTMFEGPPMWQPDNEDLPKARLHYHLMNLYDIMTWQNRSDEIALYKPAVDAILSGKSTDETVEIEIKELGRWYRTRMSPLIRQDRAGGIEGGDFIDGMVAVSMDITAVKAAEVQVRRRNEENARLMAQSVAAKEASKMKSQFLANMSHEIRTPIAGVIGMAELLLDEDMDSLTKDQRECAENIQRSANGLLTVINDILDFSKVESGRLDIEEVPFDLSIVVSDVNKMLSFAAERKGLLYIDDIPELRSWKVMGDPGRLRQVITNLLTNSIKFTSEGSVTMRVKVQKNTTELLEVEFTVQDTGIGIEEEVRERLFKPFSQADSSTARRFGGTGLGLTISKNLVELMHGKISLESTLGVGTKASFSIPFHKAPYQGADAALVDLGVIPDRLQAELSLSRTTSEPSGPATPTNAPRPSLPNTRDATMGLPTTPPVPVDLTAAERLKTQVLVVEDNAVNQQIAMKTIKKLGFSVRAVWNGKEALEYLQNPSQQQPSPDVILMDCQMPIMDGYVATMNIRNSKNFALLPRVQRTPIVAMTASAIQGDRERCEQSGMDDYLSKPVKKPNLERMLVRWAIEGRRTQAALGNNASSAKRPDSRAETSFNSQSTGSHESPHDHLSSELDRLEYKQRTLLERSNETVGDTAVRQQEAEEKAMSLRDDVLIEAGVDPRKRLGRGLSEQNIHEAEDQAASKSHMLTTENMQKLDHNAVKQMKRKHSVDRTSSVAATTGDGASVAPSLPFAQKITPMRSPLQKEQD